ncbi:hypothetical protein V6N13_088045 [Hibiscus sabdariffa]
MAIPSLFFCPSNPMFRSKMVCANRASTSELVQLRCHITLHYMIMLLAFIKDSQKEGNKSNANVTAQGLLTFNKDSSDSINNGLKRDLASA